MKTRFFALATLVLALAACNNDNENLNGDPVAAQFTADIAPATRASGTTWTGGDRIGITDIGNDSYKPGGLNNILEALSGQNVNVEYMYAFVQEGGGSATMIFRFDRIDQAIEVLKAKNIPIIPADRING